MTLVNKPTVMFYVQHLLGIGHVFRAVRVAKGLARAGCDMHIVWGGARIPGMDTTGVHMHYLEAVHVSDEDFKALLKDDGQLMSEAEKASRSQKLLQIFNDLHPDILITEAYPFGRRQMRFELLPLMEAAQKRSPKPLIVSSIRDIMQENRVQKRVTESLDLINQYYDLVMVHGDPDLIAIEETLQDCHKISDKIRYSGLVTPDAVDEAVSPSLSPDVLISAGGGAVGRALMYAAADAMAFSKSFPNNWCLTTGPDLPQRDFDAISESAPPGMIVTRFIHDLARVMSAAKVSVSRAGYNTVGDLLRAQTTAVLVPFTGGLETEQLRRAQVMEKNGIAKVLLDEELSPQTLALAVDDCANLSQKRPQFDLDGADFAAQILVGELQQFRTSAN